jgi:hypothetical protein
LLVVRLRRCRVSSTGAGAVSLKRICESESTGATDASGEDPVEPGGLGEAGGGLGETGRGCETAWTEKTGWSPEATELSTLAFGLFQSYARETSELLADGGGELKGVCDELSTLAFGLSQSKGGDASELLADGGEGLKGVCDELAWASSSGLYTAGAAAAWS